MSVLEKQAAGSYRQKLSPIERFFRRSPFAIVTVVARVEGEITAGGLREAVSKMQQRHPHLRARIVEDDDREPWLTSEGAGEIPVETMLQWVAMVVE